MDTILSPAKSVNTPAGAASLPGHSLTQDILQSGPRFLTEHAMHGHAWEGGQRCPVGDGLVAGASIGQADDTVGVDEAVVVLGPVVSDGVTGEEHGPHQPELH